MKIVERDKARALRRKGYSMNQIIKETGFTKSSVSLWVRDVVLTTAQKKKISENGRSVESIEKRRIIRLFNEQAKRQIVFDKAQEDYVSISLKELKLIGVIIYLGEGAKTKRGTVAVANADPLIIKIMLRFLREVCKVPERKLRGHIHTFAHANIKETEQYWSKVTGIPTTQFYKTYMKPSSASLQKRKTLPFGTFDLCVHDTKLCLTIKGWMEKIKELTVGESMNKAL